MCVASFADGHLASGLSAAGRAVEGTGQGLLFASGP